MVRVNGKTQGRIGSGTLYVLLVLLVIIIFSFELVGANLPSAQTTNPNGQPVVINSPTIDQNNVKKNLQLYTFTGHAPTPPPSNCEHNSINQEDFMIIGFDPGYGKTVSAGGDIRVWYTDENSPFVSSGEVIDSSTGDVTTRGNTNIIDTCSSGSSLKASFEPTLSINGKNYFPDRIKGKVQATSSCTVGKQLNAPSIDDFKPFQAGTPGLKTYGPGNQQETAEYIWHTSSLGLSPGTYQATITAHDGDREVGIICANITTQ